MTRNREVAAAIRQATGAQEKDLNIFLLMGQSNMSGRGRSTEVEPVEDSRVLMFRGDRWSVADEPLHDDKPTAGVGLGMTFALGLIERWPSARIGLVPCAVGGFPLELWEPGAGLYAAAVERPGVARSRACSGTRGKTIRTRRRRRGRIATGSWMQ